MLKIFSRLFVTIIVLLQVGIPINSEAQTNGQTKHLPKVNSPGHLKGAVSNATQVQTGEVVL